MDVALSIEGVPVRRRRLYHLPDFLLGRRAGFHPGRRPARRRGRYSLRRPDVGRIAQDLHCGWRPGDCGTQSRGGSQYAPQNAMSQSAPRFRSGPCPDKIRHSLDAVLFGHDPMTPLSYPHEMLDSPPISRHATFGDLSCYSSCHERTPDRVWGRLFARWYDRPFDFVALNKAVVTQIIPPEHQQALVIDTSFIPKMAPTPMASVSSRHPQSNKTSEPQGTRINA